jgi:hypothetical protein
MLNYQLSTDATEIIAGTSNKMHPAYIEATRVTNGDDLKKSLTYLKSFASSIDRAMSASKVREASVEESAGNVRRVKGYETFRGAIDELAKLLPKNKDVQNLTTIVTALENLSSYYEGAYINKAPLVIMEYECAVLLLIKGTSMVITTAVDIETDADGSTVFKPATNARTTGGIISKLLKDYATVLGKGKHSEYLKDMVDLTKEVEKVSPEAITEAAGASTLVQTVMTTVDSITDIIRYGARTVSHLANICKKVIKTVFGIVPLIRGVIYLHWKRKADIANNLEIQAKFIELNIQKLENTKNMDSQKKEQIIRKQRAYVDAYRRRAAKLRAELTEEERVASESVAKDNGEINPETTNDDFVLD